MTGNQTPPVPLVRAPGKTRLFLTFVCFVGILAAAAILLGQELIKRTQTSNEQKMAGAELPKEPADDWFYDEIGQGAATNIPVTADSQENYTLEIKLATSREEAEKIINMLAEMDVQAYYTPLSREGRVFYRVRRGLFADKSLAMEASKKLRSAKNVSTKVVLMQ